MADKILFQPQYAPLSWLTPSQPPRYTRLLLTRINSAGQQGDGSTLATCAVQVSAAWARSGDWLSYGTALLALGDVFLAQVQYAPATDFYAEAQTIFHLRVDPAQRQNEAAAVYGLALVAALCGQYWRALELTERVSALLQAAAQYWVMWHADYERADHCEALRQRIAKFPSKYWPPDEWRNCRSY